MAGLNWVILPFKCLLCDGEPLSVMRTKEKARPPHPASVVIGVVEEGLPYTPGASSVKGQV